MTEPDQSRKLLGERLSGKGLVTADQIQNALAEQKRHGSRLGYWFVRLGYIPVETLAHFLTENRSAGFIEDQFLQRQKASAAIARSLAHYYKIAPLKINDHILTIGLAEVTHAHLVELLSEITGYTIDALILPEEEITTLIESSYRLPAEPGIQLSSLEEHSFVVTDTKAQIKALTASQWKTATSAGERLRSIIAEAIKEKFREILVKPTEERAEVYFKKDVLKQSEFVLTSAEHDDLSFLIVCLAKMNPLQQKTQQHGRFLVKINERKIVMVVHAIPTIYGMRFQLEMFDEKILKHSYEEDLKAFPEVRKQVEDFLVSGGNGVLAITGPEESGRTNFLYSLLSRSKLNFHKIQTLENSIRYPLNEIQQNEVSPEKMEKVLEEYLFQTPDLLAISVVKSVRAAELAFLIAARMPVILVLSSYDTFKAVEWLCAHHLKSPLKAGLLHTVISPRKIPELCPHCSIPMNGPGDHFASVRLPDERQWKMNPGCDHCRNRENLQTRTFFECFRIDEQAIEWILQDPSSAHLRRSAQAAGRDTLFDLVIRDGSSANLDMLSVAKLQAAL